MQHYKYTRTSKLLKDCKEGDLIALQMYDSDMYHCKGWSLTDDEDGMRYVWLCQNGCSYRYPECLSVWVHKWEFSLDKPA